MPVVHEPTEAQQDAEKKREESGNNHNEGYGSDSDREFFEKYGTYDRYEITEEDCYDELGFCFPTWKKVLVFHNKLQRLL